MAAITTSIFLVLMTTTTTTFTSAGDDDDDAVYCHGKAVGGDEGTLMRTIIDDLVVITPDRVAEGQRYCNTATWERVHLYGSAACYLQPGGEPDIVLRCRSCLYDLGEALFAKCSAVGAGQGSHPGYPLSPLCDFIVGSSSCHN